VLWAFILPDIVKFSVLDPTSLSYTYGRKFSVEKSTYGAGKPPNRLPSNLNPGIFPGVNRAGNELDEWTVTVTQMFDRGYFVIVIFPLSLPTTSQKSNPQLITDSIPFSRVRQRIINHRKSLLLQYVGHKATSLDAHLLEWIAHARLCRDYTLWIGTAGLSSQYSTNSVYCWPFSVAGNNSNSTRLSAHRHATLKSAQSRYRLHFPTQGRNWGFPTSVLLSISRLLN